MSKKIVVLNGSPRPKGNTSALIESFAKGAQEAGHSVKIYNLHQMNIKGCAGCWKGGKDSCSPCVQKDDMDKIYPEYAAADVVVLASPLYYWFIDGQLKTAFDRLYAVSECQPKGERVKKDCVLIMAAGGNAYEETLFWYDRLMNHIQWNDRGKILCSGVMNIGDIKDNPKLQEAYELGKSL